MSDRCKSCEAPVRWAVVDRSSRYMPLDLEPVAGGPWHVCARRGAIPVVRYIDPDPDRIAFQSHFATCPNADQHRRVR